MYIKTLTIQGFKSYRDQTAIEPFSPGHNVVVGRNGSGKSNFFAAIRFVLSDAYVSMSREERQSLLHEGVSVATTLSAYVEIIFDNSDNRFPTGKDEVVLRRTIGLKKDEYSLDKKSATKADVMNLLESAGFSKANPYYIVPQGRITSLTNAKDHERLALLKEVAGTKVYEQRRTESLRIMSETESKRAKIKELLTYIEERLAELEEEKEELKEFQEKDKERRCLEYAYHQRELAEVGDQLEIIENERKQETHTSNEKRKEYMTREKQNDLLRTKLSELEASLSGSALGKHNLDLELKDLLRTKTEIECVITDLEQSGERGEARRDGLQEELDGIRDRIAEVETELMEVVPEWEDRIKAERDEKHHLDRAQAQLATLYAKQGRITQFRTRSERDAYLKKEIAAISEFQKAQAQATIETQRELSGTKAKMENLAARASETEQNLEDRKTRLEELAKEIAQLHDTMNAKNEMRKELWRKEAMLSHLKTEAQVQLQAAERKLTSTMDKDTGSGLRAIDKIVEKLRLEGVYGPLYSLFTINDPVYNTAVDQTAGGSLWHVVVDNDETASQILEAMNKDRTGRLTFVPLNRIKLQPVQFPNTPDAQPLIEKLTFEPIHANALKQVFGKTCVCRDLTIAAAYTRSHDLNTITIDGDKVDRKGALTGGYHDVRRSRIDAINAVKTLRPKSEKLSNDHLETKTAAERLELEATQFAGQISALQGKQEKTLRSREPLIKDLQYFHHEQERLAERAARFERDLAELETESIAQQAKKDAYTAELSTPMAQGLTDAEMAQTDELAKEVDRLKKSLLSLSQLRNEAASQKSSLESELNDSLRRRREEVLGKIELLDRPAVETVVGGDIAARKRELESLKTTIQNTQTSLATLETEYQSLTDEIQETREELERVQNLQAEDSRGISKHQKSTERYLAKKQILTTRRDECNKNIRDLGVLPEEAFQKYTSLKLDRLVKRLHAAHDSLKKFAHVNKKAFEQYNNFTKQRDQLLKRREDLDTAAQSIEELVEVLDQRKDEAIERTFKQVSKYFEEVFERLVPAGRGRLLMQKNVDQEPEDEDGEPAEPQSSIDSYTGISIKVSFNSKHDEGLRIQQLSGGQKSLVALATVFAIQKCDPAPFYLFDEIDANLDAQYRTAVAGMIHELSSSAQFITTTFRPEMLVTSDQFYGVLFNNQKVSSIRTITRDEAREFVEQEAVAQ